MLRKFSFEHIITSLIVIRGVAGGYVALNGSVFRVFESSIQVFKLNNKSWNS